MELFPTWKSLPGVIWYDNNCKLVSMLQKDLDSYFNRCVLLVDVFHYKTKYKELDVNCGKNCNPYMWLQLHINDEEWQFNSSAVEQVNAWYGCFQAIVQELQVDRYNFFLNKMIKQRNRSIVHDLEKRGYNLSNMSRSYLLFWLWYTIYILQQSHW